MSRYWRPGLLVLLLVGPILTYVGLGALWLRERGWLLIAGVIWIGSGILFSILAARWTRKQNQVLPPIDWDRPETFSQSDGEAWKIVEDEADRGESISQEELSSMDVYIDVGRRLAKRLAEHYHPHSEDAIQLLPVVDLLTALELASEDLNHLCRQVPGGDMITPGHWKKAVQMANYFQRANDIYSYLLPIFSPMTGLARLGSQHLMVKPAWKNMQQNLLRWFFQAYVNRLGIHLIELYSGRLAMGANQYRRLTARISSDDEEVAAKPRLTIGVVGMRGSGKSRLVARVAAAESEDLGRLKARLESEGLDPSLIERLKSAEWIEIPGYAALADGEASSGQTAFRETIEAAQKTDFLVLVSSATAASLVTDAAFAHAWDQWFAARPAAEIPPAIAVLSGIDAPELGGEWRPPYSWPKGQSAREAAIRARVKELRDRLPATFLAVIPASLGDVGSYGVSESVIPSLLSNLQKAERAALIRHFNAVKGRSKAVRLLKQVGTRGRSLWHHLKSATEVRSRREDG